MQLPDILEVQRAYEIEYGRFRDCLRPLGMLGRGELEPPTSALIRPERSTNEFVSPIGMSSVIRPDLRLAPASKIPIRSDELRPFERNT
jgi:hypothetical protein